MASKPSRQSLLGISGRTTRPPSQPPPRPTVSTASRRVSLKPSVTKAVGSEGNGIGLSEQEESQIDSDPSFSDSQSRKPTGVASPGTPRAVSGNNSAMKEAEDLKTKLRVMEKKRTEDREKLKELETVRSDKEKFEGIIQKLQAKYQPQQQELSQLRKQLKDVEAQLAESEKLQAEHESIVEMAALDREMAEEMTEAVRAEFEALKSKSEELEMEVEVLREENQELGQVTSPEERSSQGWLQMERTNERLREALLRLRDVTQQQEADLRSQIKELEEDVEDYTALKAKYESTKAQLLATETNMDELKQQVEALGAEDMIEELTEKNMQYQEQVNELKAVIEDLESLKELNDELEINHMETEKQLQEEIDFRESVHLEQGRRIAQQDEVIEDLEYTLSKFRELVSNLQSDLEDMRVSQQISETEASDLNVRSRAMIDLNMKLQASVTKAQTKTIDVELGRMEAEESAQHLAIMKLYLPEYFDTERNPILALLRFKRVGFKASLMGGIVRERISDPAAVAGQEVFTAYDVLDKLTWISCLCGRFVSFITGCFSDEFSNFEGALYELEPVERNLNSWIEGLKKNELNEPKCAMELQRSIALLTHLAETLIPTRLEAYAYELHMRSVMTQTYMDHTASILSQLKYTLQECLPTPTEEDEEGPFLFQKIDTMANQARSGKIIVGKTTRSLEELQSRSLTLESECSAPFEKAEQAAKEIAEISRQFGTNILQLTGEEGRTEPITYNEVGNNMLQTANSLSQTVTSEPSGDDGLSLLSNSFRMLAGYLEELSTVSSDLSQTVEFEFQAAPWVIRSKELKSNKTNSPDTEDEIRRLKNEIHEVSTALGVKDKASEEQTIKIELLESRMRDANKKGALVKELESSLEIIKSKEQELLNIVEKQSGDMQGLERERDEYRTRLEKAKRASGSTNGPDGAVTGDAVSYTVIKENETLRAEVASLQAAVRFLREDNRRANLLDPYAVQRTNNMRSWLDTPLVKTRIPANEKHEAHKASSECQDVLNHLMKLTKESKFVDLKSTVPADEATRLSWRPVKSTPRYHVLRQREEYEQWSQWKDEVALREREKKRGPAKRTVAQPRASIRLSTDVSAHLSRHSDSLDATKSSLPPRSAGVMDTAWRILGMQKEEDDEGDATYDSVEGVKIVGQ